MLIVYNSNTNQLNWVRDVTPSSRYGSDPGDVPDIDGQAANNYVYDEIGNVVVTHRASHLALL